MAQPSRIDGRMHSCNVMRDDSVGLLLVLINTYHSAAAVSIPNYECEI